MSAEKKVFLVSFSHLDLFWAGTREECLSRGGRIIGTALGLLEKYPEYRFMIESTSFIQHYLDCFTEHKEKMKQFVREGRLEVIPMRSIIYSHLPAAETAVRNIMYGTRYCQQELEARPTIISLSDIPGVTPQLPQIAKLSGMDGILLSRGFKEHTDHVEWTSPDGTSVRAYCPLHYANLAGMLSSEDYDAMISNEGKLKEYIDKVDYAQVVHWGMDLYVLSEEIFKNIRRWNEEGHTPLTFSTFREFFDTHQPVEVKKLCGEIPSSWVHIESSWPDIWPLDIPAEAAMFDAEFFGALNILSGKKNDFPCDEMRQAWERLLDSMDHNQNGIGGDVSDGDKLQLKTAARLAAKSIADKYAWRLAARTKAPHKNAFPIVVFNPLSWKRSEVVRARTACYGRTFATCFNGSETSANYYRQNETPKFRLVDESGAEVHYKKENHLMMLTDTLEISFFAEDIPAFGSKVYYLEPVAPEVAASPFEITLDSEEDSRHANRYVGSDVIENQFFRFEIYRLTGEVTVFDKVHDRVLVRNAAVRALEEKRGEYIYMMELSGREIPFIVDGVEVKENNAVYCLVEIIGSVYGQPVRQQIKIWADKPVFEIENIISWQGGRFVRIEQTFPFESEDEAQIRYGVPFGQVNYPDTMYNKSGKVEGDEPTANMRLVRDWVNISDSKSGMTIGADHRLWTFSGNTLANCMLRGIGWTSGGVRIMDDGCQLGVQRPPKGDYTFRFRVALNEAGEATAGRAGWELNAPMHPVSVGNPDVCEESGLDLPPMPDLSGSTVVISNIKPAEDEDAVVFRCFEGSGSEAEIELPLYENKSWFECDLLEENCRSLSGAKMKFSPFEIKTLMLK